MRRIAAPVGLLAAAVAMTLSSCALSSCALSSCALSSCALSGRADSPAASPSVPGVSSPAASASTVQVHAAVPAVFVAACGHPGAQVTVTALPVTILAHAVTSPVWSLSTVRPVSRCPPPAARKPTPTPRAARPTSARLWTPRPAM
jgi:hypothetical protein